VYDYKSVFLRARVRRFIYTSNSSLPPRRNVLWLRNVSPISLPDLHLLHYTLYIYTRSLSLSRPSRPILLIPPKLFGCVNFTIKYRQKLSVPYTLCNILVRAPIQYIWIQLKSLWRILFEQFFLATLQTNWFFSDETRQLAVTPNSLFKGTVNIRWSTSSLGNDINERVHYVVTGHLTVRIWHDRLLDYLANVLSLLNPFHTERSFTVRRVNKLHRSLSTESNGSTKR